MRSDTVGTALSTVRRVWQRSAKVMPVCALLMACLIAAMAMGRGGSAAFRKSIAGSDATEVRVTAVASGPHINDAAITSFEAIGGVDAATGVISLPLRIKAGRYAAQSVEALAVDPAAFAGRLGFAAGGLFPADAGAPRFVLGYGAQALFKAGTAGNAQNTQPSPSPTALSISWPGQSVEFTAAGSDAAASGGSGWVYSGQVTGVLAQDSSDRNSKALMNLAAARKILRGNYALAESLNLKANAYAAAIVFAKDIDDVKAIVDAITAKGYAANCAVTDLQGLQDKLALQQTLLIFIEGFAVLAAVFVMAYALMLGQAGAPAETRKSPGQPPILAEAALAGLLAGIAGVLLGFFFALIVNTSSVETVLFRMHFGQQNNLIIPLYMALETVGISTAAGFAAGWLARRGAGAATPSIPS